MDSNGPLTIGGGEWWTFLKKSDSALGNKLKDQSLTLRGGQVFNSLPIYLRNSTNITLDTFKSRLDRFLEQIPDNPPIPGLIPEPIRSCTGKHSNSIQDWIVFLKLGDRRSITGNNGDLFRLRPGTHWQKIF